MYEFTSYEVSLTLMHLLTQLKKEGRRNEYERHKLQALNQRQKLVLIVNTIVSSRKILACLFLFFSMLISFTESLLVSMDGCFQPRFCYSYSSANI